MSSENAHVLDSGRARSARFRRLPERQGRLAGAGVRPHRGRARGRRPARISCRRKSSRAPARRNGAQGRGFYFAAGAQPW